MSQLPEERQQLAAEFALGALSGEELAKAMSLMQSDDDFRREAANWAARLAPMLDEVEPVEPPADLGARIEARVANPVVHILNRKLKLWRSASAGITAIAASLALVLLVGPQQREEIPARPAPLVAKIGTEAAPMAMVATWDSANRRLMVAAAGPTPAGPGHSHELWVIPQDGTPRSLGVMSDDPTKRMTVEQAMASQIHEGATLAVSLEPTGGSRTGSPSGPVVASGKLERA